MLSKKFKGVSKGLCILIEFPLCPTPLGLAAHDGRETPLSPRLIYFVYCFNWLLSKTLKKIRGVRMSIIFYYSCSPWDRGVKYRLSILCPLKLDLGLYSIIGVFSESN